MGFKFHNSSAVEVASSKSPFYPPMEQIGGVKWSIRVRGCHLSLDFGSLGRFKDLTRGNSPGRNCKVTTISPLIFPAALTAVAAPWGDTGAGSPAICLHAHSEFSYVACVMHVCAHVLVLGARNLSVCRVSATGDNPTQGEKRFGSLITYNTNFTIKIIILRRRRRAPPPILRMLESHSACQEPVASATICFWH